MREYRYVVDHDGRIFHDGSEIIDPLAYLAGVGVGLWKTEDLAGRWKLERRFTPGVAPAARHAAYAGWRRAVERFRAWAQP